MKLKVEETFPNHKLYNPKDLRGHRSCTTF